MKTKLFYLAICLCFLSCGNKVNNSSDGKDSLDADSISVVSEDNSKIIDEETGTVFEKYVTSSGLSYYIGTQTNGYKCLFFEETGSLGVPLYNEINYDSEAKIFRGYRKIADKKYIALMNAENETVLPLTVGALFIHYYKDGDMFDFGCDFLGKSTRGFVSRDGNILVAPFYESFSNFKTNDGTKYNKGKLFGTEVFTLLDYTKDNNGNIHSLGVSDYEKKYYKVGSRIEEVAIFNDFLIYKNTKYNYVGTEKGQKAYKSEKNSDHWCYIDSEGKFITSKGNDLSQCFIYKEASHNGWPYDMYLSGIRGGYDKTWQELQDNLRSSILEDFVE